MNEVLIASALGALLAALNHYKSGKVKMFRVFSTGACFSYFTVSDVVNLIDHMFRFQVSSGSIVFMLSFFGAEILERFLFVIRTFNINIKWNKEP